MIAYHSTRSRTNTRPPSACILEGIAPDGGLYLPDDIRSLHFDWQSFMTMSYADLCAAILCELLPGFDRAKLSADCKAAYESGKFSSPRVFDLADYGDFGILELFSGPTAAFKDAAMCLLPWLMKRAKEIEGTRGETLILTATSGDTGKAAMAGFVGTGSMVSVVYPHQGVSPLQLLQMLSQNDDKNISAVALKGNFDDAQTAVKLLFTDEDFMKQARSLGVLPSSANSINIGRLLPQIAYYYHAYILAVASGRVKAGEKVNFAVPTGNFGNILAGYYAAKTGLPVGRLLCASNANNVLTDFFRNGVYDANRPFLKTASPSMDILISSNLERLLYELLDGDDAALSGKMRELADGKLYSMPPDAMAKASMFWAGFAGEERTRQSIQESWRKYRCLIDPHTACAMAVYEEFLKEDTSENGLYTILLGTASPYKFAGDMIHALTGEEAGNQPIQTVDRLYELTGVPVPDPLAGLRAGKAAEETVLEQGELKNELLDRIRRRGEL